MTEIRRHMLVSGIVQGVGFRFYVERQARDLALRGYVRNLPTGQVEIEAQGPEAQIDELERRVRQGPAASRVEGVEASVRPVSGEEDGFEIRF